MKRGRQNEDTIVTLSRLDAPELPTFTWETTLSIYTLNSVVQTQERKLNRVRTKVEESLKRKDEETCMPLEWTLSSALISFIHTALKKKLTIKEKRAREGRLSQKSVRQSKKKQNEGKPNQVYTLSILCVFSSTTAVHTCIYIYVYIKEKLELCTLWGPIIAYEL